MFYIFFPWKEIYLLQIVQIDFMFYISEKFWGNKMLADALQAATALCNFRDCRGTLNLEELLSQKRESCPGAPAALHVLCL